MLGFTKKCIVFQARGAAHIKALVPKTVLALGTCNKNTSWDLRQ